VAALEALALGPSAARALRTRSLHCTRERRRARVETAEIEMDCGGVNFFGVGNYAHSLPAP
jgi:hypothetical protein